MSTHSPYVVHHWRPIRDRLGTLLPHGTVSEQIDLRIPGCTHGNDTGGRTTASYNIVPMDEGRGM